MKFLQNINWALVVPMANEESEFHPFIDELQHSLDETGSGHVFLVVDQVSKDHTLTLCNELSLKDQRFTAVWAPENKNVADAYLAGYHTAIAGNYEFIIEMDAGLSHQPNQIKLFLEAFNNGYECVFGSRFIKGRKGMKSNFYRFFLSRSGTCLSNLLLGTKQTDMTSGFQGFKREIVKKFLDYKLLSKGHFYQTELRYLLRNYRYTEIPITYKAPSPSVSLNSLLNSLYLLMYYFTRRISLKKDAV